MSIWKPSRWLAVGSGQWADADSVAGGLCACRQCRPSSALSRLKTRDTTLETQWCRQLAACRSSLVTCRHGPPSSWQQQHVLLQPPCEPWFPRRAPPLLHRPFEPSAVVSSTANVRAQFPVRRTYRPAASLIAVAPHRLQPKQQQAPLRACRAALLIL
jgi:hypothetical protein